MTLVPFDWQLPTRIVFGVDAIDRIGPLVRELGVSRALVVSDRGVQAAGHAQRGMQALRDAGLVVELFDQFHENPSTTDVALGVESARRFRPNVLVGLGGGSSLDCAKGINFLHTNGGQMKDYWGVGKARLPLLPAVAVPTTAGTGSEAQSFALISDAATHVKMACGDKKAACRLAILDPRLTLTQPPRITALTGLDALAHAVETYVTKVATPVSRVFSREAWRLLATNFPRVLDQPDDLEVRGSMQLGACFAGMAIEHSMLGAAHGLANPLTTHYGLVHGQAVSLMLPHVIRFNAAEVASSYRELLSVTSREAGLPAPDTAADGLADYLATLAARAGLAVRLSACGVDESVLPKLASDAARQWTTSFNPRPVDVGTLLQLYRQAL
ncbi:MAG: iron-containing alcohol dehydrogenase [Pirellulaceae bacterium]|jgi:alcohol dehydrogenase|nr:iron-containing alcohol dehydrogenase [Pirellulaceae bacterium]